MSTLFETYYDSFGHELHLNDVVFVKVKGSFILGNLIEFGFDKNGNVKYVVIPSPKYKEHGIEMKKHYKVSEMNIFLTTKK